ncbi:hypothetical protein V1264_017119 [Littorina saxatilis]|uniref:Hormone-sensitive lipase n=2 Tax=Littorina saxatilis TaxID=31220 RepID=A0AAN9GGE2_9CAEN
MQRPLHLLTIAMASFGEGYQESSQIMKVATSLFNSGKYIMNPDLRAQQVVNITRTADIQFCKAFWSITESEIMHQLPTMVCPSVQVDEVFHLGPDAFDMPSADGSEEITITPPCAHTGPAPVQVRLISYHVREGQDQRLKSPVAAKAPRSRGLIVHCHGGGFVAQSSRSHEVYLRDWAKDLDVPILSIDYSLAPESPFPRALEECFYAYAWAVHNCHQLGSTGERIVLAGDSAGGNLIVSTAMRAASFDIRRPDGLLAVYTPVLVRYTPSPARLLALMDPLLPAGILSRCLAAYAGVSDDLSSQLAASVTCHIESSAATLRMSSQESQEADWVVVSQDSASKTSGTLASPQAGSLDQTTEENGDEVEIFSQPKTTAISTLVSDATGKLVSYMGSYTDLLTKSFTTARQTSPEEIPLMPMDDENQHGPGAPGAEDKKYGSSIDGSPCSSSFHTPMTTPSQAKGFPGADVAHTPQNNGPQGLNCVYDLISQDSTVKENADGVSLDLHPSPALKEAHESKQAVSTSPTCAENTVQTIGGASIASTQCMHENTSEGIGDASPCLHTPQESVGTALSPVSFQVGEDSNWKEGQDICTSQGLTLSDRTSVPVGEDRGEHAAVCDDPPAFSIEEAEGESPEGKELEGLEPQIYMPSLERDKAEILQFELDSSAASNTPSTTLPSSLLSTPSDDLNSFDILESGQSNGERTSTSPTERMDGYVKGRDLLSASPTAGSQTSEDKCESRGQDVETVDSGEADRKQGRQNDGKNGASLSIAGKENDVTIKNGTAQGKEQDPEEGDDAGRGDLVKDSDANMDMRTSDSATAAASATLALEVSSDFQDFVLQAAPSTSVDTACSRAFVDPLLSPDSGCLSDDADKMMSSAELVSSVHSEAVPLPSVSREKLRLDLHKASSATAFPRSMSQPSLSNQAGPKCLHNMSPSDFKRERHLAQSPLRAIRNIPIVKNPYMSPLLAPDWLLQGLPHVCLVACHLDPLLDDSVMFTRRLRSLGKSVELLFVDDLPHGFLNFSMVSRDAKRASDMCCAKLGQLLHLDEEPRERVEV